MTILDRFLELAEREIGVHQSHQPSRSEKRILEYDSYTTLKATSDKNPWCSSFVCFITEKAGLKSTRSAAARSWCDWGKEAPEPYPAGSIVILKRGNNPEQGHVAFLKEWKKDLVLLLGGNQKESVCMLWFKASNVISVRVPNE